MTYKTINSIVVDCSDWGFGGFNVLITHEIKEGKDFRWFYLRHEDYTPVIPMFGCYITSDEFDEDAVELAHDAAPRFFAEYIHDIFCDDCDDCDCDCCGGGDHDE